MNSLLFFFLLLIAFIFSLVSILLLKKLSFKYHLYDNPAGDTLKIHQKLIPYLGGMGIFIGFGAGLTLACLLHQISGLQAMGLILGSIIILFLGFWDDLKWKNVGRPVIKLFCQFIAGFIIVFILIKIGVNFNFSIYPILAALIAGFYIVGAMNAMNMQDGMDGLAGGLTVISVIGFFILSSLENNIFSSVLSLSLLGGIIGFLIYNWHPTSIFMGDNGSHFLGFSLAVLAIIFTGHPIYNLKQFIGPILIIGLPVIDTAWTIIRRLIKGKSPFQGDRGHLYDRLYQKGLSIKKTVLICYGIQIIIVIGGVLIYYL